MEYRQLGNSDVKVSAVAFGAWAIGGFMWGGTDDQNAVDAIKASLDAGVTSIDTAPIYGMGHSEIVVARAIQGKRDKVQILTKFGLQWDSSEGVFHFQTPDTAGKLVKVYKNAKRKRVIQECEDSLSRLATDYIDLYQQHWPDEATPIEETMSALDKLLKDGKIKAAGVSNFSVEQIERARQVVPIASDQAPYSMINRGIEKDVVPYCLRNGIGLIAYSPLQRGLLTGKITEDYEFPPGDHRAKNPFFTKANRRNVNAFLNRIRPIADSHKATLAQLAVNWVVNRPGVTTALVGARDARQAAENARAASFRLSDGELNGINDLLAQLKLEL